MCYPPSDYIILSLTKLKFYGGWGPRTEVRITQTLLLNNFSKLEIRALYPKTYLGNCPKFITELSYKNIQRDQNTDYFCKKE